VWVEELLLLLVQLVKILEVLHVLEVIRVELRRLLVGGKETFHGEGDVLWGCGYGFGEGTPWITRTCTVGHVIL
jgi:hypothetical protein